MKIIAGLILFLIVCFPTVAPLCDGGSKVHASTPFDENVTLLADYIETYEEEALAYEVPVDFSQFVETTDNETLDYGTFDFIVIGTGPAGSAAAGRLTEISDWKVLVLEAGPEDTEMNEILGLWSYVAVGDNNWFHYTTPQKNACGGMVGRQCAEAGGRVLGGSSSINGGFFYRGHKNDFARWVDIYGATGWSYEEVLPYFIKNENANYAPLEDGYHGFNGPVYVSNDHDSLLTPILLSACDEAGFEDNDINGPATSGYARVPLQYKPNKRVSGASAFIRPALGRPNMHLSLNSFVTRIIIDKTTLNATGVEFVKNGTKYVANVNYEIVLCAGPWNSAPILMYSGVGPADHLESLNISVIVDLPVGQNLQDHPYFYGMVLKTNTTLFDYGDFNSEVERYTKNLRPFTNVGEVLVRMDYGTNTTYPRPNLEYIFSSPGGGSATVSEKYFRYSNEAASSMNSSALTDVPISIGIFHPKSIGNITLQSNDPKDRPLINPNLLSDQSDIDNMFHLVNWALSFSNTTAFQSIGGTVTIFDTPGCEGEKYSTEWILCSISYWGAGSFHAVGANSIGNDSSKSVVNPSLMVHGLGNVRVADSSIIPECVTGHPSSTTYMIGERVSDIIKKAYIQLNSTVISL